MTEHMTPAELHVVREFLGLTMDDLARILGNSERTVRRWSGGSTPIPDGARQDIEALEAHTAEFVNRVIDVLQDDPDPSEGAILVYRTDAEYWAHHPEQHPYPASWHRAVVARVVQEVPGLQITYGPVAGSSGGPREVMSRS